MIFSIKLVWPNLLLAGSARIGKVGLIFIKIAKTLWGYLLSLDFPGSAFHLGIDD